MNSSFSIYMQKVADYISMEYDDCEFHNVTQDEMYTIKMIGNSYYNNFDNICNAANEIVKYIRDSREWARSNIK